MPNWTTNIVHIETTKEDDELNTLYKSLKTDKSDFDFNAIISQPRNIEQGNCSGEHKDGEVCWYDWNVENWGTKWNSKDVKYLMDSYDDDTTVYEILVKFETAWNYPEPILKEIAKKYRVRLTWKDEGSDDWHDWLEVS